MKNKTIIIAALVCALSVIIMLAVIIAVNINKPEKPEFVPPEFDPNAVMGVPEVPDGMGYTPLPPTAGMNAYICGNPTLNDDGIDVWFTSPEINDVYMKLKIFDENDTLLGETGLIKPGEYVKTVKLDIIPENEMIQIKMKIIAYEPDTWYSAGSASLNTNLGIG